MHGENLKLTQHVSFCQQERTAFVRLQLQLKKSPTRSTLGKREETFHSLHE